MEGGAAASRPRLDELNFGPQQRLHILVFLPAREIARWSVCSRASCSDTVNTVGELLWNSVYDSTCRLRGPASAHIRALVARPCGEAAVGCRVAVYSAERDGYLRGTVQAFDLHRNAYLVHYDVAPGADGSCEVWETERRRDEAARMNPLLWSQNRFRFLTLPVDPDSSPSGTGAGDVSAVPRSELLRYSSWREELHHTVANTPCRNKVFISDARDEVLFVTFSPCGSLLASCSRDKTTRIYRLDSTGWPRRVALLQHESTALRAHWWPEPPHHRITVSTGGPGERALAEVWDIEPCICVMQVLSVPFDIYAAAVRWPSPDGPWAVLAGGGRDFLRSGVQEMKVYRPPPPGEAAHSKPPPPPVCLRLPLGQTSNNYCHCPEAAPPGKSAGLVAALTGTGAIQCDAVVLFELPKVAAWSEEPLYVSLRKHTLSSRAVLSVRWAPDGGLLLVNTRPRIGASVQPSQAAPPLSTAIELLVLDPESLATLSVHGGHYAFTPSEAPFILHTDAWANNDIVASGGEDHCVHVWHRRHKRQLQRLEGHAQAVNAVSWSSAHRVLASASDDHRVILWACGAGEPPL